MLDRIHWQKPAEDPSRPLRSKINLSIELSPETPGERTAFEQALRTIHPCDWTRSDARHLAKLMIRAVSLAIVEDGKVAFPLELVLIPALQIESGERTA